MHKNKLEQYFLDKNLDVSFNTLGSSELLIELFVKETEDIVHSCYGKTSNHVKSQCYSKYYKMDERTKFTGFEKFEKLDKQLRNKMSQHVTGLLGISTIEVKKPEYIFDSYLHELKNSFKRFKNPLLYLSGGIDSEFVALAMLDAGVEFTPVIFQWVNDSGQVFNIHDILYALDFCNNHSLKPIVRELNLEKLWNNPEFELLAKETNVSSPQVNTYVYMIELMGQEFSDSTHVLGGEVRFSSRFDANSGKLANFALAAKETVANLGYDSKTYVNTLTSTTWTTGLTISLVYNFSGPGYVSSNQTWSIVSSGGTLTGSPTTGNWFLAQAGPGGTGFEYSINGSAYASLSATNTTMATLTLNPGATTSQSATFTISVRNISAPVITRTSTITLQNVYVRVPTLYTFNTSLVFYVPPGVSSMDVLVVGAGGGGGGGISLTSAGGGGGGGNVFRNTTLAVSYNQECLCLLGSGGGGGTNAAGGQGGTTEFWLAGSLLYSAQGGFGGGSSSALWGGSSGNYNAGGAGGSNSPYGVAGGGGGAKNGPGYGGYIEGEPGFRAPYGGSGGNPYTGTIGGTGVSVAGGGGGGAWQGPSREADGDKGYGSGGGGDGVITTGDTNGNAATNYTGSGGGGAVRENGNSIGGSGAYGVIYIYC